MGVHVLDMLELEDNCFEKSRTTVLERGNDGEEEGFDDITWIDDVIKVDEVDMWEEKEGKLKEYEDGRMGGWGGWKDGRMEWWNDGMMGGWEDGRKVKREAER